ncbi:hypothetical protein [uncultured Dysosmobacter sp.]|uniref:hypothetical protein n=1 Tax=uncultured Dysosmobacter sp. TaxID=2591384 RepID=UPI00261CF296|nr:hypothetical protein [uncultured Dysosmobacter sp.]
MTPNKERAIAALITYPTRKEAAAAVGITPRTLQDYFKDPEFLERYKAAFGDMVQDATRQAQQAINPALSALREILEDKDEQSKDRISAARAALEYALRLTEQADILDQLRELERWKDETDGKY